MLGADHVNGTNRTELRRLLKNSTPGKWKLWGMRVLSDQDGSSDVDKAKPVADTYQTIDGMPRTFDADLICTMQRHLPEILDDLDRIEEYKADLERRHATLSDLVVRYADLNDYDAVTRCQFKAFGLRIALDLLEVTPDGT